MVLLSGSGGDIIELGKKGVMVSTNRKKGMRGATRKTRSRCSVNSVSRPIKLIGGAALRLAKLCAGWNRVCAREVGVCRWDAEKP